MGVLALEFGWKRFSKMFGDENYGWKYFFNFSYKKVDLEDDIANIKYDNMFWKSKHLKENYADQYYDFLIIIL